MTDSGRDLICGDLSPATPFVFDRRESCALPHGHAGQHEAEVTDIEAEPMRWGEMTSPVDEGSR
jgi:hypothetical protein